MWLSNFIIRSNNSINFICNDFVVVRCCTSVYHPWQIKFDMNISTTQSVMPCSGEGGITVELNKFYMQLLKKLNYILMTIISSSY